MPHILARPCVDVYIVSECAIHLHMNDTGIQSPNANLWKSGEIPALCRNG